MEKHFLRGGAKTGTRAVWRLHGSTANKMKPGFKTVIRPNPNAMSPGWWLVLAGVGMTSARAATPPDTSPPLQPLVVSGTMPAPDRPPGPEVIATASDASGTFESLLGVVPGGYAGSPTGSAFSLRGMAQDNTVGYAGTDSNPLIQVLDGGLPLSPATLRYLLPTLWDLESATLRYGPQFLGPGPAGLGGAILLERKRPDFTAQGRAMMEAGESGTFRTGIAQNLVLIPEELALRLSFDHQEREGDAENLFFRDESFGATDREGLQAGLLWNPGKNPEQTVELSVARERSGGNPFARVEEMPGYDLFDRKTNLNRTPFYSGDRWATRMRTHFLLPNELLFESTSGFQSLDVDLDWDSDYNPVFNWFTQGRTEERRLTQDLALSGKRNGFSWVLGGYFEASEYDVGFKGSGYSRTPSGIPFDNGAEERVRVAAAYGRGDLEIARGIHLTAGLRLNHERRELETRSKVGPLPEVRFADDYSGSDLPLEIGLAWQGEDDREMLGLRLSRGTRAGGLSYATSLGLTRPFERESDSVIEVFSRCKPHPDLDLSASLFQSWIENQQVPFAVPGGLPEIDMLVMNAANSRRTGASLESRWQVLNTLGLGGSLAWTRTEFRDFDDQGTDRSGQAFPNSPEWTASLLIDYQNPSGWFGNLTLALADGSYSDVRNPEATALESRELLSARCGYSWDHVRLYVFGSNLLDDEYALRRAVNARNRSTTSGNVGKPRMIGIGTEINW
ncbi:MAG: hypothetical protein B9S38_17545 [Verrucomicrobiia bacterium Tous-C4TDCM]|nr:MAG: hypothetical protein B9S38_17545 [Verrucomicrobiae bacterium Tous-C4TDCM]